MNLLTKKMLETLRVLKEEYGILAVKAEFEAEGSRTDELISLNEVVFRADMQLFIKVGGCEAVRDMDQCRLLGAKGIMAPMIETPFAMQKFCEASQKVFIPQEQEEIEFIINAETVTALSNFDAILERGKPLLDTISIGRVDLSASAGLSRKEINSDKVFDMAEEFAKKAIEKNINVGFGGGISFEAIPFILRMEPYIDRFETRKIVFSIQNCKDKLEAAILCAMNFEYLYLKGKCAYYDRMAKEDEMRMSMLKQRIDAAEGRDIDYF